MRAERSEAPVAGGIGERSSPNKKSAEAGRLRRAGRSTEQARRASS